MVDNGILNFTTFDPFKDNENIEFEDKIHIRSQKRNGRKSITIIEGLTKILDQKEIQPKILLKKWKKTLSCNGSIKPDPEDQKFLVFQLSGNQKVLILDYLLKILNLDRDNIILH